MAADRFDVAVVGAGILGLATARELVRRSPSRRVVVLEKEDGPARHQTGHNSGVIHSGVYYAPGSAKASACAEGRDLMVAYCQERGVPHEMCGKLIVAASESELAGLEAIHARGTANGLGGLKVLDEQSIREVEPEVRGVRGLWVPQAGIVDYGAVARALAEELRGLHVDIRYGAAVGAIEQDRASVRLGTGAGGVEAESAIACAGLYSDRVARLAGAAATPRVVPFRGDYYVLRRERRSLVHGLIYPVPDPRFPFLGIHFTRRVDGAIWLGPNAVLAFSREGYGRLDVRPRDLAESLAYRGFRRLATKFWRTGLDELRRDWSKPRFLAALRRYVPAMRLDDLEPGPSGVRAQALGEDGALLDDFAYDVVGRFLNVRNAPSPAATASLALAKAFVDRLEGSLAA